MATAILLLRSINVGGKNVLPMKKLVADLESLQLTNVKTYIQSGNAVFDTPGRVSAKLGEQIADRIEVSHGFRPQAVMLSSRQLAKAIELNPFKNAEKEPKTLHLFFLATKAKKPNLEAIEQAKSATEDFKLTDDLFYLHAPDGIARSKLAASVERLLGVATTARNWRTVQELWNIVSSR